MSRKKQASLFKYFSFSIDRIESKRGIFFVSLVVNSLADAALFLSFPLITKMMLDAVFNQDYQVFFRGVSISLVLLVCSFTFFAITAYLFNAIGLRTRKSLRYHLFEHYISLPISFLENRHSADFLTRSIEDLNLMCECFGWPLRTIIFESLRGSGAIIAMLVLDYRFSLLLLFFGTLSFYLTGRFSKNISRITDSTRQQNSKINELILTIYDGFLTIKTLGLSGYLSRTLAGENEKLIDLSKKMYKKRAAVDILNRTIGWLNFTGILILGAALHSFGWLDISTLVAIVYLQSYFNNMLGAIGGALASFQNYLSGAKRVAELFAVAPARNEHPVTGLAGNKSGIWIEGLSFAHDKARSLFSGLSMHIAEGKFTALVGPSGCGKSTLLKIILGYYPPHAGKLSYFGKELGEYTFRELYNLFAYVPQQSFLYEGSILENIKHGNPGATDEEVYTTARLLKIDDFIRSLKNGYTTQVSDMGLNLSGGQQQRIAIARALLRKTRVLVLDEPTSSLDSGNEDIIMEAISTSSRKYTLLLVAHRLSTVEKADKIIVLQEGAVCEEGTHRELLARNQFYARLYRAQMDGNCK